MLYTLFLYDSFVRFIDTTEAYKFGGVIENINRFVDAVAFIKYHNTGTFIWSWYGYLRETDISDWYNNYHMLWISNIKIIMIE